ncbi:MAG: ABC transporter permease [Nitrospinae bacterium]|nr:ABC transporter permease [Nitrospinota bacterium]
MNPRKFFWRVLSVVVAFALWWLSSGTIFNPILVPAPHKVAVNLWEMTADGEILFHAWASLRRVIVGYAFGSVLGILTGVAVARIRIAEDMLEPPLQFMRNITPVAIIPLAVNAFGLDEPSKYFVIIYSTIIPVVFNTAAGVASTPQIRVRAAMCLGAGRWEIFLRVVLPSAWPFILTGLRVALGFAFMGVVAAEMIAAESGVGYLIMQSRNMLLPEQMFSGLFLLGLIGLVTDRAFQFTIGRLMRRYMLQTAAFD